MKWLKVKADSSTVQFLNLARRLFPQGILFLKIKKKYKSHSNLTRSVCDVLIRLIKLSQECYWDGLREVKTGSSKQQAVLPVKRIRKNWSGIRRRSVSLLHSNETMILEDERKFFFSFSNVRGDWQFVGQTPRLWQRSTRSWGLCIVWRQRSGKIYITIKGLVIK